MNDRNDIPTRVSIDARNDSWSAEWADGRTDSGVIELDDGYIDDDGLMDAEAMFAAAEAELDLPPGTLAGAGKRSGDGWVWKRK